VDETLPGAMVRGLMLALSSYRDSVSSGNNSYDGFFNHVTSWINKICMRMRFFSFTRKHDQPYKDKPKVCKFNTN